MANWSVPIVMTGLLLLVGCQAQTGQSLVVDNMPSPNFSGPTLQDEVVPYSAYAPMPAASTLHAPAPERRPIASAPSHKGHDGIPVEWTPLVKANSWEWIVVHHSATPTGGAKAFDIMHKAKGWDELGYHFVIGNGTDTRDGQIEVGPRWPKQKWGAHTKTPDNRFNEHGIGICLVGNFDISRPDDAQMKSLAKLVSFLMKTYHIPADHVLGHRDCKSTDCPGKNLSIAQVRRMSVQMLADAGDKVPESGKAMLARGELLHDGKASATR